jgi:hypothetical protein
VEQGDGGVSDKKFQPWPAVSSQPAAARESEKAERGSAGDLDREAAKALASSRAALDGKSAGELNGSVRAERAGGKSGVRAERTRKREAEGEDLVDFALCRDFPKGCFAK